MPYQWQKDSKSEILNIVKILKQFGHLKYGFTNENWNKQCLLDAHSSPPPPPPPRTVMVNQ